MAGPDYIVELGGETRSAREHDQTEPASGGHGGSRRARPWLAVRWRCCSAYSRIYRNKDKTAYEGWCPKCARPVRVAIGPDGSDTRFFEAH